MCIRTRSPKGITQRLLASLISKRKKAVANLLHDGPLVDEFRCQLAAESVGHFAFGGGYFAFQEDAHLAELVIPLIDQFVA